MALDKEDIDSLSKGRDPYYVEKDYLQDLFLFQMFEKGEDALVFKGGTALSKFYNSDRFSEDLDFTARGLREPMKYFLEMMARSIRDIEYQIEYRNDPSINRFGTIAATLAVKGPRYVGRESTLQQIRIEINTNAALLLEPVPTPRAPPYPDARNYVALVMDRQEALAEKVRAIMSPRRRHKERDLYDMYFLISKSTPVDRNAIARKLDEADIVKSGDLLKEEIEKVAGGWKDLEPIVRHRLEDYAYVRDRVAAALKGALD